MNIARARPIEPERPRPPAPPEARAALIAWVEALARWQAEDDHKAALPR